jgi:ABC-type multidrug transport system ATPase subunit
VRQAYVRQEDIFYTQMTVRETLMFAARLRLPSSVSLEEKRAVVDSLLNKLSLVKAADTIVGDAKRRGISGGERKRLSIGCELIGSPNLLFLDEPTSGLDAFQAQQVVALLKQLALEGTAVVAVIHQPRGTSFKMFDDLLLLSEGQLMFSGEAARAAAHFGRLGHRCPSGIAEAEHVVDLVSADYSSPDALAASLARIAGFATTAAQAATTASVVARAAAPSAAAPAPAAAGTPGFKTKVPAAARSKRQVAPRRANVLTQFALLFGRAWREVARSKAALIIKATQQVGRSRPAGTLLGPCWAPPPQLPRRRCPRHRRPAPRAGDDLAHLRRDLLARQHAELDPGPLRPALARRHRRGQPRHRLDHPHLPQGEDHRAGRPRQAAVRRRPLLPEQGEG